MIRSLDIILDPFYFGMGNTFYEAMAFNIPVVTMPTNHLKSRFAFAAYMQMDIKDAPIAKTPEEYITITKRLVFNNPYREQIKSQINKKYKTHLFNDKNNV